MQAFVRDKGLHYVEVACQELDCMVWLGVDYSPGRPGVHTLRNGDPGYPDEPPTVDVCEVWVGGVDVAPLLTESLIQKLTSVAHEPLYQAHRDRIEAELDERYQAQRDDMAYR